MIAPWLIFRQTDTSNHFFSLENSALLSFLLCLLDFFNLKFLASSDYGMESHKLLETNLFGFLIRLSTNADLLYP